MHTLVFDIETVGEDFDTLDSVTQKALTKRLEKEAFREERHQAKLDDLKKGLTFSPLTGEIVVIGVLDCEKNQATVYFQAPGETIQEFTERDTTFKQATEKEMLKRFWQGAAQYDEFITFSGRGFDAPFLMIRSAIHRIRPSVNLLGPRYLYQQMQRGGPVHYDLQELFTFEGAVWRREPLHLFCRAFGIESPKAEDASGDKVEQLFKEKRYLDIARYNAEDIRATKELYEYWDRYLRF